jgi:hypothetical protein
LFVLVGDGPDGAQVSQAAEPAKGELSAKGQGTDLIRYEDNVPPGTGSAAEECQDGVNADVFTLTLSGLSNAFYEAHTTRLQIRIDWNPSSPDITSSDLALILRKDGATVSSSDGGAPQETVTLDDAEGGEYEIVTCAFSNGAPQPYKAEVGLSSTKTATVRLPKATGASKLKFGPIVTVDPQRDVAEPSLRIDKAGNIYTCGPFGSSRAADYAQKSEDGGDTYRVLGQAPEGRIAPGGGGDCEISVATEKNAEGNYNLSYVGLEALANFSTGRSTDAGRSFTSTSTSESPVAVDRQWLESVGEREVFLFYNQIPEGGTAQHSTDGGLTYSPPSGLGNAAPDISRPGNIVIDPNVANNPDGTENETVYIAYTNGLNIEMSRSTDDAQTFKRFVVGKGEGAPDNLFPSIAIDTAGNLYVAWTEKGSFNTFYSYSKNQGETWSPKQLVNRRGANTTVMPWIEVGDPGRVAVSTYCSKVDGNPEVGTFRGPWNVCVNQSLNALGRGADFSQVKATSHPIHWDSICLSGLGCNVSNPPGDRTLLDFFQIRANPKDGRLTVVYNESNKIPGQPLGRIAIVTTSTQRTGPSLFGGNVSPDRRANVRSKSADPRGDAIFPFSSCCIGQPPPNRANVEALDIQSLTVDKARVKVGDKKLPGLSFKLDLKDISQSALQAALAQTQSQELKFVIRWFSAYGPDYLVADYDPAQGFVFGAGHLQREQTADSKLEIYPSPGRKTFPGKVDEDLGALVFKVPYRFIQDIDLRDDLTKLPRVGAAKAGDKIFEVTAFTFGNQFPAENAVGTYYNQADSTPSMDYKLR